MKPANEMRPQGPRPITIDTALIVRLRDQDGLTFGQIAEQVGMSVPNSAGMALWVSSKPKPTRMDMHALIGNRLCCCTSLLYRPSDPQVRARRHGDLLG